MTTIQKISFAAIIVATLVAGLFAYVSIASAQVTGGGGTGCTNCGGSTTGGGGTVTVGDGGGGGGAPSNPPVCDIRTNIEHVPAGQQYTISWANSNNATYTMGGVSVQPTGSITYTWDANNVFLTFTVTGQNGDGTCSDSVTVYRDVPAPTCDITTNLSVVDNGQGFTISWRGTPDHSTVFRVNNQIVAAVDSQNYTWPAGRTTPVTVTMTGNNAKGTCSDSVTVSPRTTPQPLPACVLTANPTSITSGGQSTLTWSSTNASSATINQSIGSVSLSGNRGVNPAVTTTYTMTVTNETGSASCAATVTVVPPTSQAPICDSFTGTPTTINRGQSATLTWNTTNASSVVINQGVGSVAVDGSTTVSPLESITYTLTATGANNQQVTCTRPITVIQPETPRAPICDSFTASASSITRGDSVSLSWNTTNVNNVVINPSVGSVAVDGSTSVSPSDTTTYTLTGTGDNNQTVSCTRTVTVTTSGGGGGGGGGSSSPRCTLKISDSKISRGDRITITWDTSRATEVTLKDSHGKTIVTTDGKKNDDKKDLYDGSITLRPEKDTTYTLLAERGSKDRTCKVSVDVKDGVTVLESRDQQPVVTGISLTQVPYTGFEAGPFLTMVFYGLLVLWALYLAYVIVMRRQGVVSPVVATATPVTPAPAVVVPTITETPRFVASVTPTIPTAPVGYASTIPRDEAYDAIATEVENMAHAARVLISSEAMRQFVDATTAENRTATATAIIEKAKASYPSEDGWVVVNLDRMNSLCALCLTATTPAISVFTPASVAATAGNGSLAEAIVTGNIVAAYQMIGARPMVSLAEAAAELDALYRMKQGNNVTLSALMTSEGARFTPEQVKAAIEALTSALDGVYTNEGEAVKMAILKAIKALA